MKKFTHRNDAFVCAVCQKTVPEAQGTCRNHCTECLCSKHIDVNPGDRASDCGGIMRPVRLEFKSGLPSKIFFKCEKCGFERPNKVLEDDNRVTLMKLSSFLVD